MPAIPYIDRAGGEKIGQVEPTMQPTQPVYIHTTPDMFGANVGHAIEQLGGTLEHSGDEIFNRAQAMLEVKNQADADHAMVQAAKEIGQRTTDFRQLNGINASPEALAQYTADVEGIRQKWGQSLSAPLARQHYDADSRRIMIQDINTASNHAGEQLKQAYVQGLEGRQAVEMHRAEADPNNEAAFQAGVRANIGHANAVSDALGDDQGKRDQRAYDSTADMMFSRLKGMYKERPFDAKAWFNAHAAEFGAHRADAQNLVDTGVWTTGARNIPQDYFNGTDFRNGPGAKQVDPAIALKVFRQLETGNLSDERAATHVDVETKREGHAIGMYGVMSKELNNYLDMVKMPRMTEEEFKANPAAQQELMTKWLQLQYSKGYNFNDAMGMWLGGPGKDSKHWSPNDPRDYGGKGNSPMSYAAKGQAYLAQLMGEREAANYAERRMTELAPNDANAVHFARTNAQEEWRRVSQLDRDDIQRRKDTVQSELFQGMKDGTLITQPDQLSPEAQDAFAHLPAKDKITLMTGMANNSVEKQRWTPEGMREADRLRGLAASGEADDAREFLDTDLVTKSGIPNSIKWELMKKQDEVRNRPGGDPHVQQAMSWLQGKLLNADISKKNSPDDYNAVQGAVAGILQNRLQSGAKAMTYEEVQKLGDDLISNVRVQGGGWFGRDVDEMLSKADPPADFRKQVINDWKASHFGAEPDETTIKSKFIYNLYQSLAEKRKAEKPAP